MSDEQKYEFDQWVVSAEDDWQTAEFMLKSGRYVWALFILQLSLEKLIKALIIKSGKLPPLSHNLEGLYSKVGEVPKKYSSWLQEISDFNITARYDIEKEKLHKKATIEFTKEWFLKGKELRQWLKKQLN
jgi:HEPN domain-containing protein